MVDVDVRNSPRVARVWDASAFQSALAAMWTLYPASQLLSRLTIKAELEMFEQKG